MPLGNFYQRRRPDGVTPHFDIRSCETPSFRSALPGAQVHRHDRLIFGAWKADPFPASVHQVGLVGSSSGLTHRGTKISAHLARCHAPNTNVKGLQ